jgi:hypothetical protein
LGLNDFDLRTYDPQIGRWLQQDPYDQFASPYVGMGNDPVNMVDEDGGFSAIGAVLGGFAGWSVGILSAKDGDFGDFMAKGFSGMALGALAGGFLNAGNLGTAVQVLGGVQTVAGALGSNSEVNAGNSTPIKGTGAGHGASAKNDYNDNFDDGGPTAASIARAASTMNKTHKIAATVDLVLGGPENPIADVAAVAVEVIGACISLWQLFDTEEVVVAKPKIIQPTPAIAPPKAITPVKVPVPIKVNSNSLSKQSGGKAGKNKHTAQQNYKKPPKGQKKVNNNQRANAEARKLKGKLDSQN